MPIEVTIVVVGLLVVLFAGIGMGLLRATRGAATELDGYRRRHRAALEVLVDDERSRWAPGSEDDWDSIRMEADGLELHLGVAQVMQRDTFIEYLTRLTVTPKAGRSARLSGGELPAELAERLARVAVASPPSSERLVLTARPSEPVVRRYSYAMRLQLDPEVLRELLALGRELWRSQHCG